MSNKSSVGWRKQAIFQLYVSLSLKLYEIRLKLLVGSCSARALSIGTKVETMHDLELL